MSVRIAYFNGHFIPDEQARLSLHDAGFVWGATVTDRCRSYNRKWFRLAEHLARFRHSCELCRVPQPVPDGELTMYADHLLEQNGPVTHPDDELVLILFATPGEGYPNLGMLAEPMAPARYQPLIERGAILVTPPTRQLPAECVPPTAKMRSRLHWWIAEQQAREVDPEASALLLDLKGHVTETAMANVLIVRGKRIISPPRGTILSGISLGVVAELCGSLGLSFVEEELTLDQCADADEALLTSTAFGVAGVSRLNGRSIPWPGPVLTQLHAAWSDLVGMDIWRHMLPSR